MPDERLQKRLLEAPLESLARKPGQLVALLVLQDRKHGAQPLPQHLCCGVYRPRRLWNVLAETMGKCRHPVGQLPPQDGLVLRKPVL